MFENKQSSIATHVEILGWLHIIGNAVMLGMGLIGFVLLTGIGQIVADPVAYRVLNLVGIVGVLFFGLLALPGIVAGYGLLKQRSWARWLAMVVAVFSLVNIPIGTAIGIYTIVVLLQPDADGFFAVPKAT